jgi:hypothetical protein
VAVAGNAFSRALRRLAPRKAEQTAWRVGPSPASGPSGGRALERFLLLAGGPVRLLLDDVLVTVGDGALLRLRPEERRRLIVLDHGVEPVWLSLGPDLDAPGLPR